MNTNASQNFTAWRDWLAERDWDVFGTLNLAPGHKLGTEEAQKLWSKFWNEVDRQSYGQSNRPGFRVERMVFSQFGASGDNPHIHFLARSPIDTARFCVLLNAIWAGMSSSAAPPTNNEILPIISKQRASGYVLHDLWHAGSETFNHQLSHISLIGITAHKQADIRLERATTGIWLARAQLAFENQAHLAQARYDRRHG